MTPRLQTMGVVLAPRFARPKRWRTGQGLAGGSPSHPRRWGLGGPLSEST